MRRPVVNNSGRGDTVRDPFPGGGATLITAETDGRKRQGRELNTAYVDVTVRRWQAFTGGRAVLKATGETFDGVAARAPGGPPDGSGPACVTSPPRTPARPPRARSGARGG